MNFSIENRINEKILKVKSIENDKDSIDAKILSEYVPESLLRYERITEDESITFIFNISSFDSLKEIAERSEITSELLRLLLIGIIKVGKEVKEFLLTEKSLIFKPDYIFVDKDRSKVFFCFIPGSECDIREDLILLSELLISRADYEDKNVTKAVYEIYDRIQKGDYDFTRMLSEVLAYEEENSNIEIKDSFCEEKEDAIEDEYINNVADMNHKSGPAKLIVCLLLLSLIGIVLVTLRNKIVISMRNKSVISILAVVLALSLFFTMLYISENRKSFRRKKRIMLLKELAEKE